MAVIVYDGFDHYAGITDIQARAPGKLNWSDVSAPNFSLTTGRGGYGQCVTMVGGWVFGASFNYNFPSGIPAVAMLCEPSGLGHYIDFLFQDFVEGSPQFTVRVLPDSGVIQVWSGDPTLTGSLLISSPPNATNVYTWQMYEFYAVIGTSGSVDVHVNGTSVFGGIVTGVNLQSTGSSYFNGFTMRGGNLSITPGGPTTNLDDFRLTDLTTGTGTYPANGFLGDTAVRTLFTAANSSVQWTPLTSTNYVEVGETAFDGDTSYNYATTVGDKDLFTFGSLPTTVAAVFAVQITGAYRKLDASAQTILQNLVSGSAATTGATWGMSLQYSYVTDLFVLDPNTTATWTSTAVNSLIAGYTLNS